MKQLPTPPNLDFPQTLRFLLRGPEDPVNIVTPDRWRRAFRTEHGEALLEASYKNEKLHLRILAGELPSKAAKTLAEKCLGLDEIGADILTHTKGKVKKAIQPCAGILMPGYPTFFEALVQTIFGQQVSTHVAHKQRTTFAQTFGTPLVYENQKHHIFPAPERVANATPEKIHKLGISNAKARAIHGVAQAFALGQLEERRLAKLPVEDAIQRLIQLHGVGRWTAEWSLLRGLRKFSIVPAGDLAVRKALTWALAKDETMSETEVRQFGKTWRDQGGVVVYRLLAAYVLAQEKNGKRKPR